MADLFFVLSKVFWALLRPDHLLLLLLTLGWWRLRRARRRDGRPAPRRLLSVSLLLLWSLALHPVGNWLLWPLETRFAPTEPDPERLAGILVLGGGESVGRSAQWHRLEMKEGGDRYLEMLLLAREYPELPVIFAGGSGHLARRDFGGADALAPVLVRAGLEERVLLERASRNTWENALLARPLAEAVEQASGRDRWLLVTSAFHMPRAVGAFRRAGWKVDPWPVDYRSVRPWSGWIQFELADNLMQLNWAVHEWVGLAAYRLTGKSDEWLPGSAAAGPGREGRDAN